MINFKDYILEAGTNPLPIIWETKGTNKIGYFVSNYEHNNIKESKKFEIEISILDKCKDIEIIQFKFFNNKSTRATNENKYMFQVLATVRFALYDYVEHNKPEMLLFAASDDNKARKAIYKLESARLANKFDYFDVSQLNGLKDTDILFGIYKDKKYINCIKELTGIKFE